MAVTLATKQQAKEKTSSGSTTSFFQMTRTTSARVNLDLKAVEEKRSSAQCHTEANLRSCLRHHCCKHIPLR